MIAFLELVWAINGAIAPSYFLSCFHCFFQQSGCRLAVPLSTCSLQLSGWNRRNYRLRSVHVPGLYGQSSSDSTLSSMTLIIIITIIICSISNPFLLKFTIYINLLYFLFLSFAPAVSFFLTFLSVLTAHGFSPVPLVFTHFREGFFLFAIVAKFMLGAAYVGWKACCLVVWFVCSVKRGFIDLLIVIFPIESEVSSVHTRVRECFRLYLEFWHQYS